MFSFAQNLMTWGLLLTSVSALPGKRDTTEPIPPKQDPWYAAPAGYESEALGSILKIREAPGNLTSIYTGVGSAYNILYRTSNSAGNATWAVTTVLIPETTDGSALVSYQVAYDSYNLDISPSYQLYFYDAAASLTPTDVDNLIALGYYVSVPDYEGPLAAFTAGVLSGHAVLDSVRAVLSSDLGLSSTAKYALWGYSGGALASEWATELQLDYAPELDFAGVALGGLTPNVSNVMLAADGTGFADLVPSAILGLVIQFESAYEFVLEKLNPTGPYNATTFLNIANFTADEASAIFDNQDITLYFEDGYADILNSVLQEVLDSNGHMGYHGIPQMPLYVYKAINDELSPVADTDDLVDKYCADGVNILYDRNTVGGHVSEAVNGDESALEFLYAVLSGAYAELYPTTGCTIENVTIAYDTSAE